MSITKYDSSFRLGLDRLRDFLKQAEQLDLDQLAKGAAEADALRAYAKTRNMSVKAQNECAIARIELERRIGELLKEREMNPGGRPGHEQPVEKTTGFQEPLTLEELGYDKEQSRKFQLIAYIPQKKLTEFYQTANSLNEVITDSAVVEIAKILKASSMKSPIGTYTTGSGKPLDRPSYTTGKGDPVSHKHNHIFDRCACGARESEV